MRSRSIAHDLAPTARTFLQLYGGSPYGVQQSHRHRHNLANHNAYGVKGDGDRDRDWRRSREVSRSGFIWAQNVLLGGAGKGSYPAETWYDLASVPAGVVVGR
jgi:hypothetical protein